MAKVILRPSDFNLQTGIFRRRDNNNNSRKDCWSGSFFPAYMTWLEAQRVAEKNISRDPLTGKINMKPTDPTDIATLNAAVGDTAALEELFNILGNSSESQFKGFMNSVNKEIKNDAFWAKWGYARGAQKKFGQALRYIEDDLLLNKFANPKMGFLKYYLNYEVNPVTKLAEEVIMDTWYGFLSNTPLINTFQEQLDKELDSFKMQYYATQIEEASNKYLLLSLEHKPELEEGMPEVFRGPLSDDFKKALKEDGLKEAIKFLPNYNTLTLGDMVESSADNAKALNHGKGDYETERTLLEKISAKGHVFKDLGEQDKMGSISGTEKSFANLSNYLAKCVELQRDKMQDQRKVYEKVGDDLRNLGNNQELVKHLSHTLAVGGIVGRGAMDRLASNFEDKHNLPNHAADLLNLTGAEFQQYSEEFDKAVAAISNPTLTLEQAQQGISPVQGEFYKAKMRYGYEQLTKMRQEIVTKSQRISLVPGSPVTPIDFNDVTLEVMEQWAAQGHVTGYRDFKRTLNSISDITQIGKPTYGDKDVELKAIMNHYTKNLDAVTEYKGILESSFDSSQLMQPPPAGFKDVCDAMARKVHSKIGEAAIKAKIEQLTGKPLHQTPAEVKKYVEALVGMEAYSKYGDLAVRQADPKGEAKYQAFLHYNQELRDHIDAMVENGTLNCAAEINKITWDIIKDLDSTRAASAEVGGPLGQIYGRQMSEEVTKLQAEAEEVRKLRKSLDRIGQHGRDTSNKDYNFKPADDRDVRIDKANESCEEAIKAFPKLKEEIEALELLSEKEEKIIKKDCAKRGIDFNKAKLAQQIRKFAALPDDMREEYLSKFEPIMDSSTAENLNTYGVAVVQNAQSGTVQQQGQNASAQQSQVTVENQEGSQEQVDDGKPKVQSEAEWKAQQAAEAARAAEEQRIAEEQETIVKKAAAEANAATAANDNNTVNKEMGQV